MALLGLKIPDNISEMLNNVEVPGKRDSSNHLTMFYFENDLEMKQIIKICQSLSGLIQEVKPFDLMIREVSCFPGGEDGVPIKGEVESDDLLALRAEIADVFDNEGIEFSQKWPEYKPHVTLSYNKEEIDNFDLGQPIKWTAHKLTLWGSDIEANGINVEIPLGKKISKANIIDGLASKFIRKLGFIK